MAPSCIVASVAPGPHVTSDADLDAYVREKAEADYHSVGTSPPGLAQVLA